LQELYQIEEEIKLIFPTASFHYHVTSKLYRAPDSFPENTIVRDLVAFEAQASEWVYGVQAAQDDEMPAGLSPGLDLVTREALEEMRQQLERNLDAPERIGNPEHSTLAGDSQNGRSNISFRTGMYHRPIRSTSPSEEKKVIETDRIGYEIRALGYNRYEREASRFLLANTAYFFTKLGQSAETRIKLGPTGPPYALSSVYGSTRAGTWDSLPEDLVGQGDDLAGVLSGLTKLEQIKNMVKNYYLFPFLELEQRFFGRNNGDACETCATSLRTARAHYAESFNSAFEALLPSVYQLGNNELSWEYRVEQFNNRKGALNHALMTWARKSRIGFCW